MRCFFSSVALHVIGRKPHFASVLGSCSFNSSRWSLNMPLVFTAPDIFQASQMTQWVKNLLPEQETPETRVQSLGQEDPLEEEMPTHSSILPGKTPWTEKPGRLQFMGLKESNTTQAFSWDPLAPFRPGMPSQYLFACLNIPVPLQSLGTSPPFCIYSYFYHHS